MSNSVRIAAQTRETVLLESAACAPSASASVASTSRTDSPRTNPAITSASRAWLRVTPAPNSRDANASVVPRTRGRCTLTAPVVVFTITGR